ncbi:MAG: hypothetical protein JNL11_06535 [Bdellovibrionaceae bacterium]|nr:hypothetical protein [Pseudobdellovibrionaceae bacterium]
MKSKFLATLIERVNRTLESTAQLRLVVGGLVLVCWFYPVIFSSGMALLYPSSLLFIIGFIVLVYRSVRIKEFKSYLLQREIIQDRRLNQEKAEYKYTANDINRWGDLLSQVNLDKSSHWDDLDLVKAHGLLPSIHFTGNVPSLQHLIELMRRQPLTSDQVLERQSKVQLLTRGPRRKALTQLSRYPETTNVNTTQALLKESLVKDARWLWFIYAYYALLWVAYVGYLLSGVTVFAAFLFGLFFVFPLAGSRVKIFKTLSWVSGFEAQLSRLRMVKKTIQNYSIQASAKKVSLLSSFSVSTHGLSFDETLSELNRIIGALGLRQNFIAYGIVHAFLPWDFYWTNRAEAVRKKLEPIYLRWVEDLVEFEAFLLLAEYSENIKGVWPTITGGEARLRAEGVRHPLIPARVVIANDVELNPAHRKCLLVTGSNMSGKSTFLRTLGINLMLMRMGCKVHANSFESSAFQVLTSLKRVDSLEESLSTFYSEVKNLKEIRDECVLYTSLYLIDEIFRGTNNRERLIGAQKYIKALLQSPSMGLVTTHDLELSQMDQEYKNLVNEHFADRIENGKMIFDYKKKLGPCPSTNALKVMEMEGVF